MSEANSVFFTAAKQKLRFNSSNGHLQAEDLWDLPLKKLDEMAVAIDATLGKTRKSFLENPDPKSSAVQVADELRMEVLKAVIADKQDENKAKREAADKSARRESLKGLLEKKKIDQLESLSAEDIEKELAALSQ